MLAKLYTALKALVSRVPWDKVAAYLNWAYNLAKAAAAKTYAQAVKILTYIQNNPGKIIGWFLDGYSIYDIIRIILG